MNIHYVKFPGLEENTVWQVKRVMRLEAGDRVLGLVVSSSNASDAVKSTVLLISVQIAQQQVMPFSLFSKSLHTQAHPSQQPEGCEQCDI